jgi:hypothetical protein
MLCKGKKISFLSAFFAIVLSCLGAEIEMSFISFAVSVAVIEKTFCDEFFATLTKSDAFLRQVFCDCNV